MWLKRGVCTRSESGVPSRLPSTDKEVLMTVIIGVDPHKAKPHSGGHLRRGT